MTLQQLVFFAEIADKLNFTKAAEALYTSQSSLSHTISALEAELGVQLFVRGKGKRVFLSKYGDILLPHAKQVLNSIELARNEINLALGQENITIHISHSHTAASIYIPAVINAFEEENGEAKLIFHRDVNHTGYSPIRELLEGKTDMVIAAHPGNNQELEAIPVAKQQLFVLVHKRHPLSSRQSITLEEVCDEHFALMKEDSDLNTQILDWFSKSDMSPPKVSMYSDWGSMVAAISSNLAVSISPRLGMATGIIRQIPLDHEESLRSLYLIIRKDNNSGGIREFVDFCIDYSKRNILI